MNHPVLRQFRLYISLSLEVLFLLFRCSLTTDISKRDLGSTIDIRFWIYSEERWTFQRICNDARFLTFYGQWPIVSDKCHVDANYARRTSFPTKVTRLWQKKRKKKEIVVFRNTCFFKKHRRLGELRVQLTLRRVNSRVRDEAVRCERQF